MGTQFFSIIMPTYNRDALIGRAIESVIAQSFDDWELVIIDDGSTDTTAEVISSYADERITCHYQPNRGHASARNTGIRASRGTYICFLDSDDQYMRDHLQVLHHHIVKRNYPVALLHTLHYKMENGVQSCREYSPGDFDRIKFWKFPHTNSVCIHRTILETVQFNPEVRVHVDPELYGRIASKFEIITLPTHTTVTHRGHARVTTPSLRFYKELEKTYTIAFSDPESIYSRLPHEQKQRMMRHFRENVIRRSLVERNYAEIAACIARAPSVVLHLARSYPPRRVIARLAKRWRFAWHKKGE